MFKSVLASVMLLALAGCASGRGTTANEAQSHMIGMSKEQILTCMGPPDFRRGGIHRGLGL